MVRPGLLRTKSPQSLCIFCASRVLGQELLQSTLPSVSVASRSRRRLNTTRSPHQNAAAAQAQSSDDNGIATNSQGSWDPNSTLTAAEFAEKQRRLAVQRERNLAEQKERDKRLAEERERENVRRQQLDSERRAQRAAEQERQSILRKELEEKQRLLEKDRWDQQTSRSLFNGPQAQTKKKVSIPSFATSTQQTPSSSRSSLIEDQDGDIKPLQYGSGLDQANLDRARRAQEDSERARNLLRRRPSQPTDDYQITPFDSNENEFRQNPFSTQSQTNQWQHLRIRYQRPREQPTSRQSSSNGPRIASDEDIDRQFAEHRQQRQNSTPLQRTLNMNVQMATERSVVDDPFKANVANRKCARCLEYGHHARDCKNPIKGTCHVCGQPGHFARDCPTKAVDYASPFASPSRDPFKHDQMKPGQDAIGAERYIPEILAEGPRSSVRRPSKESSEGGNFEDPFGGNVPPPQGREAKAAFSAKEANTQDTAVDSEREIERRARRSSRGVFEDEEPSEKEAIDRRPRRQSRRTLGVIDEEAADEAAAAREQRAARKAERKAAREAEKLEQKQRIDLPAFISLSNLAQALSIRYEAFVSQLERLGYDDLFAGKVLNAETSGMIAMEYGFDPIFQESRITTEDEENDLKARPEVEDKTFLPTRPPVVTIMGHVDHGKTTILDYLRNSSVAAGEAGGITQHIGAFSVRLSATGKTITFLDTPGHAAFLAMRQRGANITDIVILVVAADDSVKPQTLESLRCAREAGVPIIVAINKVDKEEADIQRVKQDLARNGVEIEDFGGETQVVCVSGKTGQGIDELEEAAVTLSEILDHRAETTGEVEGWIVEASTKERGRVATVLVKRGTLRPGNVIVAGQTWARVRTLRDEAGKLVQEAGPGMPVEVDGWRDQPSAGDQVLQAPSEQKAGDVVDYRLEKMEREKTAIDTEAINEARRLAQEKRAKELALEEAKKKGVTDTGADVGESTHEARGSGQMTVPFIIKADVSGSAEAVSAYIPSLTSSLIAPQILHSGVGAVHESDIELASVAEGHIIAFNLPSDPEAKAKAESMGVKVLENNIIYRVLDDVKEILEEKLPPIITQRVLGEAEISLSFDISLKGRKKMWIAGCKVRNGVVNRGSRVRVMRGDEKVYDGTISSLKNVKKDVQEMRKGTECGIGFEEWEGFQVDDQVQTYEEISEKRRL